MFKTIKDRSKWIEFIQIETYGYWIHGYAGSAYFKKNEEYRKNRKEYIKRAKRLYKLKKKLKKLASMPFGIMKNKRT